jgi:hypothetical protein
MTIDPDPSQFEHTPLLTLEEAAAEAARFRAPLHAWCVLDGDPAQVFFHGEMVIHLEVLGLEGADALAVLMRQPSRLFRIERDCLPKRPSLVARWTDLRAAAELRRGRGDSAPVDGASSRSAAVGTRGA